MNRLYLLCSVASSVVTYCSCFCLPSSQYITSHIIINDLHPTLIKSNRQRSTPTTLLFGRHDTEVSSVYETDDSLRRQILLAYPSLLLMGTTPFTVSAAETPAEAIRILSSKTLPGLGPPDVYYPPYFVGKWKVTRLVTTSEDSFYKDVPLPLKVESEMRFVPYDAGKDFENFSGDNANDSPAIADRAFNERSFYNALASVLFSGPVPKSLPSINKLDWTPTNPNVLSMSYADGSSKEVKVTKRSSDVSKSGDSVFSSEFRRITAVPAAGGVAGGIPSIYKSRVLTKWKQGADGTGFIGKVNLVEGIEIAYNEQGTLGDNAKSNDPLLMMGGGGSGAISSLYGADSRDLVDWKSTKTKILMERIVQ